MQKKKLTNANIAGVLEQIADLLELQDANPHRVRAYRQGARSVRDAEPSLAEQVARGDGEALQALPDIGQGLSRLIVEFVHSGRSSLLERLQGEVSPVKLFAKVPGIGETLAERIADQLDVSTLEALEQAAHDGRLREVEGFGQERVRTVRLGLAGILSSAAQRWRRQGGTEKAHEPPPVDLLLDVDAEYRRRAEAGELKKIAPKRFNPEGENWLPILHTTREGWNFTALYSNTARAHDLGKTHDWVVLYYDRDGEEDQATVVTETHDPLEGERVVRGRKAECRQYYASH
jgi:DNA uptake protein ComE-like DNA-binding protein